MEYVKDADRFADLVNGTMFCGKQVIDPQYLTNIQRKKRLLLQNYLRNESEAGQDPVEQEETKEEGQTLQQDVSYGKVIFSFLERERDILMLYERQGEKCFIGCEGQTAADYCMPVRKLTYDGIEYSDQLDQLQCRQHKTKEKSGISMSRIRKPSIRNGKISST